MPTYQPAVAALPALPTYSEADILGLFERLLPDHYLEPLKDPGPGYEMLQTYAAVAARLSTAVSNSLSDCFISRATGGSYATGEVQFYRESPLFGALTLLPGTVVATADGYEYTTLDTIAFGATDIGPLTTRVKATVRGWLYNKIGERTAASGELIPGSIDRMTRPLLPPPPAVQGFDPTLKIRHTVDCVGGAAPMLDGLGVDRGIDRYPDESDESYRVRIMLLPQTVTPSALQSLTEQTIGIQLESAGLTWSLYETWDMRVQTAYDWTPNQTLTEAELNDVVPAFNANVFVWDYAPGGNDTTAVCQPGSHSNRWYESGSYRGALIVALPNDPTFLDRYTGLYTTLTAAKAGGIVVYYVVLA